MPEDGLIADAVYEICRASESNDCIDGDPVWSWHVWDHIVQDSDSSITSTYVENVADYPNKVDINYVEGRATSDWTHGNAVDYNSENDQVMISLRNFSEYWVIDHSDASQGIIHRNGNPAAHGGSGERSLYYQHDAQWIAQGLIGEGNILVFNNGLNRPDGNYSSVDEFCYGLDCEMGTLLSSYSEGVNGEFYADHISGAQRLGLSLIHISEPTRPY